MSFDVYPDVDNNRVVAEFEKVPSMFFHPHEARRLGKTLLSAAELIEKSEAVNTCRNCGDI
jgi:hypothetical protein